MALMLSKTYGAFIAAGAPEGKAREASEEIAGFKSTLSKIEADLLLLKWMSGLLIAGVASLVIKAFF